MSDTDPVGPPDPFTDPTSSFSGMPGRLLEMPAIGLIVDLLPRYEARPEFLAELRRVYAENRHILCFAHEMSLDIGRQFAAWYERQSATRHPPIPFATGKYPMLESWQVLVAKQGRRQPTRHVQNYTSQVRQLAATWMVGAPWGAEVIHAALVVWHSNSTWRGTRLSVGGGSGPGLPVLALNVVVQFDPDGHTWGQVREWVLRDAKQQFDRLMSSVRARERRTGRSERVDPPPSRRRQTTRDESTRLRDLRWLFMTLAPDPALNRPLNAHEVFDAELGNAQLNLSTVEKALSDLRRYLDLS